MSSHRHDQHANAHPAAIAPDRHARPHARRSVHLRISVPFLFDAEIFGNLKADRNAFPGIDQPGLALWRESRLLISRKFWKIACASN